ncbi:NUDIX domain-containing protein, partial [Sedimenticola sp.]|uniref:NUDIX domain-containing protein n=1 Tax=Sedimenticola sp. TaxID=1940285 RepID=UPI003D0D38BD
MIWTPHTTVASIVEDDGRFLMVEEMTRDGKTVFNQPAGHLEEAESLLEAVIRETREETR